MKSILFLPLTQGKFATIDLTDYEIASPHKWYAHKCGRRWYAESRINGRMVKLHRFITDCPDGLEVNHINGDGLDNSRENLQVCTPQQQTFAYQRKRKSATSKYRGVSWYSSSKCWRAKIEQHNESFHLGYFDNEEAAARAYDAKAVELFGKHASLNFSKTKNTKI